MEGAKPKSKIKEVMFLDDKRAAEGSRKYFTSKDEDSKEVQ
jgi:hypothetical protein